VHSLLFVALRSGTGRLCRVKWNGVVPFDSIHRKTELTGSLGVCFRQVHVRAAGPHIKVVEQRRVSIQWQWVIARMTVLELLRRRDFGRASAFCWRQGAANMAGDFDQCM
jgi:hypothetical protein